MSREAVEVVEGWEIAWNSTRTRGCLVAAVQPVRGWLAEAAMDADGFAAADREGGEINVPLAVLRAMLRIWDEERGQ